MFADESRLIHSHFKTKCKRVLKKECGNIIQQCRQIDNALGYNLLQDMSRKCFSKKNSTLSNFS